MYARTDKNFATRYFWWFFLIQNEPMPERMIGADSSFYLRAHIDKQLKTPGAVEPEAFAEYLRCYTEAAVQPSAKTIARPPRSTSRTMQKTPARASRRQCSRFG
jgi:hypothetical protein